MGLLEMGDIAGCRIIVKHEQHIPKIIKAIEEKLNVVDRRDYISNPRESGYRSYHLMIKPESGDNLKRLVEVQIRSQEHHNWATLVEITDQLYSVKVKEGEKETKLERFHFLLSKRISELCLNEMVEIIKIEKEMDIYVSIIRVILKNHIKIRSAWLNLNYDKKDKYFILEVNSSYETNIITYSDFEIAQTEYLNKFIKTDSNVVLTHISDANFDKISTAYSNYVLTMHKYELDIFRLLFEIVATYANNGDLANYDKYIEYASKLFKQTKRHVNLSIDKCFNSSYEEEKKMEWISELEGRVNRISPVVDKITRIEFNHNKQKKPRKVTPKIEPTLYKKFLIWLNT
tara:strand:- start:1478 stop:2512 length:1035 start_codon:yes stop_codon:yes gene_type:complete